MTTITSFSTNPFQENTFIVSNEQKDCWIVDPGCYDDNEWAQLKNYILENDLNPIRLINTHCHIDHVFGNHYVFDHFNLLPEFHEKEQVMLDACPMIAQNYGLTYKVSPKPQAFIKEGTVQTLGKDKFEVRFTPGHSPGSICFVNHEEQYVIAGDVLFYGSIGRTDLPMGDHPTLIKSIKEELLTLPDNFKVYCGHGPSTTIGHERSNNPFLF